jgi:hypothetical protein
MTTTILIAYAMCISAVFIVGVHETKTPLWQLAIIAALWPIPAAMLIVERRRG